MKRDEAISRLKQHEADLKRLGVEHLYMFGSTARGDAKESWLGLSEQLFRFDKWNLCLGDESDGPAKRDRLISFFT
jgi:predicted nucleotidyltransferase